MKPEVKRAVEEILSIPNTFSEDYLEKVIMQKIVALETAVFQLPTITSASFNQRTADRINLALALWTNPTETSAIELLENHLISLGFLPMFRSVVTREGGGPITLWKIEGIVEINGMTVHLARPLDSQNMTMDPSTIPSFDINQRHSVVNLEYVESYRDDFVIPGLSDNDIEFSGWENVENDPASSLFRAALKLDPELNIMEVLIKLFAGHEASHRILHARQEDANVSYIANSPDYWALEELISETWMLADKNTSPAEKLFAAGYLWTYFLSTERSFRDRHNYLKAIFLISSKTNLGDAASWFLEIAENLDSATLAHSSKGFLFYIEQKLEGFWKAMNKANTELETLIPLDSVLIQIEHNLPEDQIDDLKLIVLSTGLEPQLFINGVIALNGLDKLAEFAKICSSLSDGYFTSVQIRGVVVAQLLELVPIETRTDLYSQGLNDMRILRAINYRKKVLQDESTQTPTYPHPLGRRTR